MNVLVFGGAGSGKSAFAEQYACTFPGRRVYVATMANSGREAQERIDKHLRQRDGMGFETIECHASLEQAFVHVKKQDIILLDDLGNLAADALFSPDGLMADPKQTLQRLADEVFSLADAVAHLVVVGNDVGGAGLTGFRGTDTWITLMGSLCCQLAARFDVVVEVVSGIPYTVKGSLT